MWLYRNDTFSLSLDFIRLVFNEWAERAVDVCEAHVLDVDATGRDWRAELAAVEVTLRSQVSLAVGLDFALPSRGESFAPPPPCTTLKNGHYS